MLPDERLVTDEMPRGPSPQVKCELGDVRCTFPGCGCSGVCAPSPTERDQSAAPERHPRCPSITRSEFDAAQALLDEMAAGTDRSLYWLTFAPYEAIAKHLRLAVMRSDLARSNADRAAATGVCQQPATEVAQTAQFK